MRSAFFFLCCCALASALSLRQKEVAGGPRGPHPYLFKGVSQKRLVETGRDHHWSIMFHRRTAVDTIRILALRVEFNGGNRDSSTLTTGNGLFGIRGGGDKDEFNYYASDTVYRYDDLPHDSLYFANQLAAVADYFAKVSRGKLVLESSLYPARGGEEGYAVPQSMTFYSPGGKKKKETWDEYYFRKTRGLMLFIRDAILAAAGSGDDSPFATLRYNEADRTFRDQNNRKTVILIFHAGSSYLTDGGTDGAMGQDSPSDMIDAFIDPSWFKYFKDMLKLARPGVMVHGAQDSILIDELMMCSETSNQDGLNWGIQGILVNQVARQLGIPDLFSTSSGISAIGAFCIMDFAGYSAGNGFVPPYPSAWVRAFMGWDDVKTARPGAASSHRVKALTSVLDRDPSNRDVDFADTSILLVPLSGHEYYLIENRQRNLSGNDSLFRYDSLEGIGRVIAPYPYNVNIDSSVVATSGNNASNVILQVRNNDISLPACGVVVWHVDERVIRDRLATNLVNADSLYRGVGLVEADGVFDLGITFQDVFYQAAFDYGGAEDVFPHRTERQDSSRTVSGFGPHTAPSTRSNDGGNTYLSLSFSAASSSPGQERASIVGRDYAVVNVVDSLITVRSSWDYVVPGWPKYAAPEQFFEPVLADLDQEHQGSELVLVSRSGRVYAWSADTGAAGISYGQRSVTIDRINLFGDTIRAVDTVLCIDSVPNTVSLPSVIGATVFIPSATSGIRVVKSLSATGTVWDSIALPFPASSYVCRYKGDSGWAVGCEQGRVVFGTLLDTTGSLRLGSDSPVCAVAALRERSATVVVMQNDGTLSLCSESASQADTSIRVHNGIGPYTLVTGDLDRDNTSEIVICDSRHGLWVYELNMALALGWEQRPLDWPSVYSYSPGAIESPENRSLLPENRSAPMLADLNRDGYLDIVVSGTNGLYAFNYKGVLVSGWPSYLDTRFWYQRGSVLSSPIALTGNNREPLVLFSSPTGERATFRIAKIERADKERGIVWFRTESNALDSMWELDEKLIDTLLTLNDSLVAPYITPGGFVDAVKSDGKRPLISRSLLPAGVSPVFLSSWPLATGSSLTTSPLAGHMGPQVGSPDLFAVATSGWVYRWRLAREILPDSLFWPQVGYDRGRSFAYGGPSLPRLVMDRDPITMYSYPNPTAGVREVYFKYKFSGAATKVRLDIFTFTGFRVFSSSAMGLPPSNLTGSYPDWNEFRVPVNKLGPAVYRCRMEATINGKKYEKFWKLAVTR
ncbi:MAG: hypothetical protein JXA71_19745 [Chitinispirillaceae bacterium]|nr:hypothetical protein [Chitinispirillaceae bacterium]